jgi:hypothetical protein
MMQPQLLETVEDLDCSWVGGKLLPAANKTAQEEKDKTLRSIINQWQEQANNMIIRLLAMKTPSAALAGHIGTTTCCRLWVV